VSTKKSFLIDLQVTGASAAQAVLGGVENNLKGIAKNAAGVAAAYISVSGLTQLLRHSVDQAIAAETAQKKLATAIGKQSAELLKFASIRQQTTRFDDDGTVAAMAAIGAFTSEEKVIKRLTIAAQDLAEAKGMDLASAAELVAKSVYGSTIALGRYGVIAEGASGSTQRLDQITRGIADLWGGQASAAAGTLAGKLSVAQNAFDDMAQSIGERLAPTLKGLADLMARMLSTDEGLDPLAQSTQDYRASISHLVFEMQRLGIVQQNEAVAQQVRLGYQALSVRQLEDMLGANVALDNELLTVIHSLEKYNKLYAQKNQVESGGGGGGSGARAALELRLQSAAAYRLEGEAIAVTDTSLMAFTQSHLEAYDEQVRSAELTAQFITLYPEEAAALGLVDTAQEKAAKSAEILKQKRDALVGGTAAMLGSFASLNAAAKGNATLTKRLAQGEAIINTYAAATLALRNPPGPPWTIPFMIAAIAQGMANVAQIQSQNFADGGWVRGQGGSRSDSVPTRLSAGERVLSAREIAAMGGRGAVDAIAAGRMGGGIVINLTGPVDRDWFRDVATPEITRTLRRALA
jgi:hypothetical protein